MLMMMLWQMPSQVIGAYDNGWHGFNAGDMNADDGDTKAVIAIMTRLAALIVYDIASNEGSVGVRCSLGYEGMMRYDWM